VAWAARTRHNVRVAATVAAHTRVQAAGLLRRASERLSRAALPAAIELPEPRERDRALVIGRSTRCDLTLSDSSVSRWHAELVRDGERWVVRDMGSTNGTRVNGWRVRRAALEPGDVVALGAQRVVFGRRA
jgi:pSer/pThr/pTyr-binding forkhead associated (FHA) protein